MSSKIVKLIWDFRGESAKGIAEHHAIHLNEFAEIEHVECYGIAVEKIADDYYIAGMLVKLETAHQIKDRLKPHRAIFVNI